MLNKDTGWFVLVILLIFDLLFGGLICWLCINGICWIFGFGFYICYLKSVVLNLLLQIVLYIIKR